MGGHTFGREKAMKQSTTASSYRRRWNLGDPYRTGVIVILGSGRCDRIEAARAQADGHRRPLLAESGCTQLSALERAEVVPEI